MSDAIDADAPAFDDHVQPFRIEALALRGRLVRLGPALEAMLAPHDYPPAVTGLLGETLALAAVLASGLKYEGVFTLQTQSDGPIGLMVVDVLSDGAMRGYARFDAARLAGAGDDGAPVPRLLGAGRLAFTVDQGADTERYQGITPLEGATLTECAHNYFRQSEQLDTAIVLVAAPLRPARAAALMIQRMPGGVDDDDWHRAVALMSTVREREMLDPGLAPTDVLYRLYHQEGVRAYRRRRLRYACRCSRRRVGAMLTAFSPGDIADMVSDGRITVTCEFCKAAYHFTPGEVAAQGAA